MITNKFADGCVQEWIIDGGPFVRTSGCIPVTAPLVQNKVWMKDRFDGSGGMFTKEALVQNRSWCLSQIRLFYIMMEKLLADGRDWILGSANPTLAELHAGWVYDWGLNMAGDMQVVGGEDPTADMRKVLSKDEFPRTHAWVARWRKVTGDAEKANTRGGPIEEGQDVEDRCVSKILNSSFVEPDKLSFDKDDVLALELGSQVSISPVDFGFTHEDTGSLVSR